MKAFWHRVWEALLAIPEPSEYPVEEYDNHYIRPPEPKKHEAWCSLCGWSGTNVEFQAHLQNHHRNH